MLRGIIDLENNGDLRIKTLDIKPLVIGLRFKHQPVGSAGKRFANEEKGLYAAVFVGPGMAQFGPTLVCVFYRQGNRNAPGRRAA